MVEIYFKLIINKRWKFHGVLDGLKDAVKAVLEERGYDINGDFVGAGRQS